MSQPEQPPTTYRQKEIHHLVSTVDSGKCISVIGAPSVGKTRLLRYLCPTPPAMPDRTSPWEQHTTEKNRQRGPLIPVRIDPNLLLPPLKPDRENIAALSWPGFELFIHRLRYHPALRPTPPAEWLSRSRSSGDPTPTLDPQLKRNVQRMKDYLAQFRAAHELVTSDDDPLVGHLALRHLENTLEAILEAHKLAGSPVRIVFLIDEFEYLLAAMPDYFFVALRGLRDRFHYQISYVTFTRHPLPDLAKDRIRVLEPLVELFSDNPLWLGPYGNDDAWRMVDELERRSVRRDDNGLRLVISVTGGFAGLLRASFEHAQALSGLAENDYVGAAQKLYHEGNVEEECDTLLRSLTDEEIDTLYAIGLGDGQVDQKNKIAEFLRRLSLLYWDGSRYHVRPYLLSMYILSHRDKRPKGSEPVRPSTLPD